MRQQSAEYNMTCVALNPTLLWPLIEIDITNNFPAKKITMHYDALGEIVRHGSPNMKPSSYPSKRVGFFKILI